MRHTDAGKKLTRLQIQNGGHLLCESSKLVAHSPGGHWWQVANQCSQFFVKLQSTQLKKPQHKGHMPWTSV